MKVVLVLCLAITAVYGQSCPKIPQVNPDDEFGNDMEDCSRTEYTKTENTVIVKKAEVELSQKIGDEAFQAMKASESCGFPSEYPFSERHHHWSIWRYYWKKNCEPCPPRSGYLWRFYGRKCFVIRPYWQRVRRARCTYRKCQFPCQCENTKCFPSEWHRIWFWAWCFQPVGGWHAGLNFHYLYLPQDCTCYEQVFYKWWLPHRD